MLVERIGQTARLLDVHHHAFSAVASAHPVVETAVWAALLRAFSGFEPFLKNFGPVTPDNVATFLVFESRFPRSIAYCVGSAHDRLRALVAPDQEAGQLALKRLRGLDDWLRAIAAAPFETSSLHGLLTHVVDESAAIFESIGRELLGHTPPPQAVADVES